MPLKAFVADKLTSTDLGLRCCVAAYRWLYHLKRGKLSPISEKSGTDRRFFLDITTLITTKSRDGIRRVMYKLAQQWIRTPPMGYKFAPVCDDGLGYRYVDTEGLFEKVDSFSEVKLLGSVDAGEGDVFLSLDLMVLRIHIEEPIIREWRRRGVKIYWTIHDLIPYRERDVSAPRASAMFKEMLDLMIAMGDGIVCVSRYVADDVLSYMREQGFERPPLAVGYAHHGSDLRSNIFLGGESVRDGKRFLMVGSITSRKCYRQVIEAFDILWRDGADVVLTVIGRTLRGMAGVDELAEMMRSHSGSGRRLIWNDDASDDDLMRAYAGSGALIYASCAEGFGLPLIEAAQNELPIIVRDHPLFHEVCGDHALFFDDSRDPQVIADAVMKWMELNSRGEAPQSKDMPWLTWAESARQWERIIFGGEWYKERTAV